MSRLTRIKPIRYTRVNTENKSRFAKKKKKELLTEFRFIKMALKRKMLKKK